MITPNNPASVNDQYTEFYVFTDDDVFFYGRISKPKEEVALEEYSRALERVPVHLVFPAVPTEGVELTVAPSARDNRYIKRADMTMFDSGDGFYARIMLAEAVVLEGVARHPHPNIVCYHGIRVRRGRITGIVSEKHKMHLLEHVKRGLVLDREKSLEGIKAAVAHLHSLGLGHSDMHPEYIMVAENGRPVLIDFGSCDTFGKQVLTQRPEGFAENFDGVWRREHDEYGLARMEEWLEEPWFD